MCQTIFEKASPRQESQTVTCLSVTFDLKAQTCSVFRKREYPFLYFLSGFPRLNISNKLSTTVRGRVSEFGSTCSGGFHVLHETCGTQPYFLCQAMLLLRD